MAIRNINDNDHPTYDLREIKRRLQEVDGQHRREAEGSRQQSRGHHITSTTEEIVIGTDEVFIDESYQRNYSAEWSKWIADHFDPEQFKKPEVSRRPDGKYAVIDGQHRIGALRILWPGERVTFVADLVTPKEGVAGEAKRFRSMNTHVRKTTTRDDFRAAIAECDESALVFVDIVEAAGFIVREGRQRQPGVVTPSVWKQAPRIIGERWPMHLEGALRIFAGAWGTQTYPAYAEMVISLMIFHKAYSDHPAFRERDLVARLQREMPQNIANMGKSRRYTEKVGAHTGIVRQLVHSYNTGRRNMERMLPPHEGR